MKKPSSLMLTGYAFVAFTAAAALSVRSNAHAQEGRLYWADAVSICEDPCTSLVYAGYRCVKLDPIIIVAH